MKNTELEKTFEIYNSNIIGHKIYELVLIYNIGMLKGMELSDMKKDVSINSRQSKRVIDFYKYLNKEQLKFLEDFKIFIDNRIHC